MSKQIAFDYRVGKIKLVGVKHLDVFPLRNLLHLQK
jgi:hypothetical protein